MRLSAGIIAMEPRQHDRLPTLPGEGISIDIARQINLRQIEWTLRKIRLPSSKPNYSVELVDPDGEFDRSGANMGMRSGDDALTQSGARCGLNTSIELLHTMIGLWADKCSGSGRGRRYFWIVPWSRLLCWSKFHPSMGRPCVVRSVFIHSFIVDHNSMIAVRSGSEAKKLILKFKPSNEQDRQVWIRALQEVQETATSLLFQYHQKQQAL
jgi:hypothetical protein